MIEVVVALAPLRTLQCRWIPWASDESNGDIERDYPPARCRSLHNVALVLS